MKSSLSLLQLFLVGPQPISCTWKPAQHPEAQTGNAADSLKRACGKEGASPEHSADQGLDAVEVDGGEDTPGLDEASSEAPSKAPDEARDSQQQDHLQAYGKVNSDDDSVCEHVSSPYGRVLKPSVAPCLMQASKSSCSRSNATEANVHQTCVFIRASSVYAPDVRPVYLLTHQHQKCRQVGMRCKDK